MHKMREANRAGFIYMTFFILAIVLIQSTSATTLESYGTKKVNEQFTFCQICSDATYITLSSIETPNSTLTLSANMTSYGAGQFCYNYTATQIGRYDFRGISDGCENTFATYIDVTNNGKQEADGVTISLFSIFYLIVFAVLIYIIIYSIGHFLKLDFDLIDLAYSYGTFFVYLTLFFLSKYYVGNAAIENIMELLIYPLGVLLLIVPLIMFVISLTVGALKPQQIDYGTRRLRRSRL